MTGYAVCSNNFINGVDMDGKADFWHNGKVLGILEIQMHLKKIL